MISSAVQERMRELREKEAVAKADAEKMEQLRIEGIKREVEARAVEWEAELLFEIEKNAGFMEWLRKKIQSPAAVQEIRDLCVKKPSWIPFQTAYEVTYKVIAERPVPTAYTLENERMRLRYRVMATVIASIKDTIRAEELAEKKRLAEVARVAAEEKTAAYEAWVLRRQAVLDRHADGIRSNMKTPYHTFMGVDPSNPFVMYVRYDANSKILTLENLRIHASDTKIEHTDRFACPPTMKAPASWNGMFEKGQLPFLTRCPVCSDQVTLNGITGNGMVDGISCSTSWEHYRWDPATNTNIKQNQPWDPRDPDGSKAARAARDKKIAETEAEIARLQAQLEALKKT